MLLKLNINIDGNSQLITIKQDRLGRYFNFTLLDSSAKTISFKNIRTFEDLVDVFVMLFCYGYSLVKINTRLEQEIKSILENSNDEIKEYNIEVQT